MRRLITIGLAIAIPLGAKAQYEPATAPETTYAYLSSLNKVWNVGTDTRAEFAGPYGGTSVWFANFLNVTVTDHAQGLAPRFYWNGSHTGTGSGATFGNLSLPNDAYDPDVVLIENDTRICALIVYYSPSLGGYCMSWTRFVTTSTPPAFEPLSAPMLIQAYSVPNDSLVCINIDADNDGNYAIAYQMNNQTYCKTGMLTAGSMPVPSPPANTIVYNDHIQPDVTLQHSLVVPNMKVKVVGLRSNRSGWKIGMSTFTGTPGPVVSSSAYAAYSLNNPRIASPLNNTERYAITLMRNNPGSGTYQILFNAYTGITSTSSRVLNTGAAGFPPAISAYVNRLPAITYVGDLISIGWHTAYLPGPPSAQTNTFVGLDLQDGSFMPTTPTEYQDICPSANPNYNPFSALAVSGRYTLWGKSAAYEMVSVVQGQASNKLVWVIKDLATSHWRPGQPVQILEPETSGAFMLSPNPSRDFVTLTTTRSDVKYTYFVFDLYGKKVLEGTIANGKSLIDVQRLAAGTYFVRLTDADNRHTSNVKFVKQ